MDGLVITMLAILAGVVAYLVLSQRKFQRIDYAQLLDDEAKKRLLDARIQHLEALIVRLVELENSRRQELEDLVDRAGRDIDTRIKQAEETLMASVINRPGLLDRMLAQEAGMDPEQYMDPAPVEPARDRNLVSFLRSPRQQQVAELLELGYMPQDVSRILGVSRHEVDLVASIIFRENTA